MDVLSPFSLRYHNRDGGTAVAPTTKAPVGDGGDEVLQGDPMELAAGGVAGAYVAGNGVFGVALYDFPTYVDTSVKDRPQINQPLVIPVNGEAVRFRVQAKLLESEVAVVVTQAVLGGVFDLAGDAGEMYLDVSAAGTDFFVVGIEETVSEWGDLYPILIVQCVNPQIAIPS